MTRYRLSPVRGMVLAAVAAVALVLAGCGGGSSHNSQDVAFAQAMIPHHRQAVEMAGLASTRAASPKVKALAGKIDKAQQPEIDTMSDWLESWGESVPAEDGGTDHSGHDMSGMMSEQEMRKLEKSSGKAFDTAFLKLMVEHHKGAVAMAKTERAKGEYPPAKKLARNVVTSQTAEIDQMNRLLGRK